MITTEYGEDLIVWHPDNRTFELWIDSTPCHYDPQMHDLVGEITLDEIQAENWDKFIQVCKKYLDVVNDPAIGRFLIE